MDEKSAANAGTASAESAEELAGVLRGRRSINLFEPDPIDVDVILDAIETARWAPNHRLTEPWRFYIVGPEKAGELAQCAAEFEAATKGPAAGAARLKRFSAIPGNLVVTSRRSDDEMLDREDYAATCCAVQNLMLYLWKRGVGVKWTTGAVTREQSFYDVFGIDPAAEHVVGLFWYGRPKTVGEQKRKPVEDIVVRFD